MAPEKAEARPLQIDVITKVTGREACLSLCTEERVAIGFVTCAIATRATINPKFVHRIASTGRGREGLIGLTFYGHTSPLTFHFLCGPRAGHELYNTSRTAFEKYLKPRVTGRFSSKGCSS